MAKSKFYLAQETQGNIGVMGSLSPILPDERPITAISIVENTSKCPEGYFPILKTYDEDSDADLWKQPVIFGKRNCRYICISKSKDVSATKLTGLTVLSLGDTPPAGYAVIAQTSDTNKPAWRRRQLCFSMVNYTAVVNSNPPLTDIIVCSKLKKAPLGFQYVGDINGMMICYKTRSTSASVDNMLDYQNVLYKTPPPDPKLRAPPERPPKACALVAELDNLNLQNDLSRNSNATNNSNHDYEILNASYSLTPIRPAPPAPALPPVPPRVGNSTHSANYYNSQTLGSWNPLEGVTFVLSSRLSGSGLSMMQLPTIKKRSLIELNQQYSYNFLVERQT